MSMWYLGMNTPSVFHGCQVLATEIDAPLSGIRWQLGPRLVPHGHKVKESRASTQHEISPFARHVPCIFQVGVQQAKHHSVSLPWFCTVGDFGSQPSWSSCRTPRSLASLLRHGLALCTTARVRGA